ncbi:hypothetical protein [Actinoplanes sp. HUAS TT8]|uniref:hypothetical protein n=1 Tax=Actinoplanes sp. HUAS TT8 TaxID=3447453 RepID=UPI003F527D68
MNLPEVLQVFRRRWWILLGGFLVTALVAWFWAARPPTVYRATEVFAVQPPQTPDIRNQLAVLRPSVATFSAGVAQRLSSPSGKEDLRRAGVTGTYVLTPRNSGTRQTPEYLISSVQVTATEADEASALRSLATVTAAFTRELGQLQDASNIAAGERITITMLAAPDAVKLPNSRVRALGGSLLLGGGLSLAAAMWADEFLLRRRRRAFSPEPVDA